MDFWHVWAMSGWRQKLCFWFLLVVVFVTIVRVLRLAWWRLRVAHDVNGPSARDAAASIGRHRAIFARSTHGLAEAAFAFTCAGAVSGLIVGSDYLGLSSRPGIAILAEQWLDALAISAAAAALCAGLFLAAWAFEGSASDARASHPTLFASGRYRSLLWPLVILMTTAAVFEMRVTYDSQLAVLGELRAAYATWLTLRHFWSRLELLFTVLGGLIWLSVLIESAHARGAHRARRPA